MGRRFGDLAKADMREVNEHKKSRSTSGAIKSQTQIKPRCPAHLLEWLGLSWRYQVWARVEATRKHFGKPLARKANATTTVEKFGGFFKAVQWTAPYYQKMQPLGTQPREMKANIYTKACAQIFTAALPGRAQNWEKPGGWWTHNGVLLFSKEQGWRFLTHTMPWMNPKHPREQRKARIGRTTLLCAVWPYCVVLFPRTSWERPNNRGGGQNEGKARGGAGVIPEVRDLEGSGSV